MMDSADPGRGHQPGDSAAAALLTSRRPAAVSIRDNYCREPRRYCIGQPGSIVRCEE